MMETMETRLYLNLYETRRCYGGPEEGGWYYICGLPVASVPIWSVVVGEETVECDDEEGDHGRLCEISLFGSGDCTAGQVYQRRRIAAAPEAHDLERARLLAAYLGMPVEPREVWDVMKKRALAFSVEPHLARQYPWPTPRYR